MVHVHIDEQELTLLVLDFLRQGGFYKSLRALEEESGESLETLSTELSFLRGLILDGKWPEVEQYLEPFRARQDQHGLLLFAVRKQMFLELLSSQCLTPAVVELVDGLKKLEEYCSKDEFHELCYLLTLSSLSDHPKYTSWTPYAGRMECFCRVRQVLEKSDPHMCNSTTRVSEGRLRSLVKMGVLYDVARFKALHPQLDVPKEFRVSALNEFDPRYMVPMDEIDKQSMRTAAQGGINTMLRSDAFQPSQLSRKTMLNEEQQRIHPLVSVAQLPKFPSMRAHDTTANALDASVAVRSSASSNGVRESNEIARVSQVISSVPAPAHADDGGRKPTKVERGGMAWSIAFDDEKPLPETRDASPAPVDDEEDDIQRGVGAIEFIDDEQLNVGSMRPIASWNDVQAIRCCSWSVDGQKAIVGTNSRTLQIIEPPAPELVERAVAAGDAVFAQPAASQGNVHYGSVYCLDWCRWNSSMVVSGSNDRTLKIWNIPCDYFDDDDEWSQVTYLGHRGTVRSVGFLSANQFVSCGENDCAWLRLWDVGRPQALTNFDSRTESSTFTLAVCALTNTVATGGVDGFARLWDVRTNAGPARTMEVSSSNSISGVSWLADSRQIVCGLSDGAVYVLDTRKLDIPVVQTYVHHSADCRAVDGHPTSPTWALTGAFDGAVAIVDLESQRPYTLLEGTSDAGKGHRDKVLQCKWRPASSQPSFLSVGADKRCLLWESVDAYRT